MGEAGISTMAPALHVDPRDRWPPPASIRGKLPVVVAIVAILHLAPLLSLLRLDGRVGDETRPMDGVTVELIDAAELHRRQQPAPNDVPQGAPQTPPVPPAPPTTPQMPTPEPVPSPAEQPQISPADIEKLLTTPLPSPLQVPTARKPLDLATPSTFANLPPPAPKSPAEEISPLERYLARQSRSPRAAAGEVDAFTTAVARALERVKPVSPGVGGRLVIAFVVSPFGRMDDLRLVESSGSKVLDDLILRAASTVNLPSPPVTASLRDRTFEIAYNYR